MATSRDGTSAISGAPPPSGDAGRSVVPATIASSRSGKQGSGAGRSLTVPEAGRYTFRASKHNRPETWGRNGFDGIVEAGAACRGPLLVQQVETKQTPTHS